VTFMAKVVLGKGLGALINTPKPAPSPVEIPGERVEKVALSEVVPSPMQPRKQFEPEHLQELVDSIREHGIIQPLIVRRVDSKCELIAGERRWRAATQLGLKEVPVLVRQVSDRDALEMALIENLQREDLNPIEEAQAYKRLAASSSSGRKTSPPVSARVGRSWPTPCACLISARRSRVTLSRDGLAWATPRCYWDWKIRRSKRL
jgi:ParB family transcriptional regulator, chromosome partitioning protein